MKIKYADYLKKETFNKEELLGVAWGSLIIDPPLDADGISKLHPLPAPPLLMFDRITHIEKNGSKGRIVAEQDISLDDWFFQCHFRNDPVQPGCLGVDAVWQLLGFYGNLCGALGAGRALTAKEIEFFGQIRPHNKKVRYEVNIRRYLASAASQSTFIIGSGTVFVDDDPIYIINEAKVGFFNGINYTNYPHMAKNAVGGLMKKE